MRQRVNFIGIGAQKCASTWVHEALDAHPQTFLSKPKELDYFSYFYGRGHDWYESFFTASADHKAVGDNSPSYFPHPLAAERAAKYNPNLRIIVALRDPIERAFSNHLHMIREGFLSGSDLSFERGLARNAMYIEQSRYATHLRRWFSHFPRDRIHVVFQEEISLRPEQMAKSLYRFLDLDETMARPLSGERANESSVPRRPLMDAGLRSAAGLLRRSGLGRLVTLAKQNEMVRKVRKSNQINLREVVPPISAETRQYLLVELASEMQGLCTLLGRHDLPWRSFVDLSKGPAVSRGPVAEHFGD